MSILVIGGAGFIGRRLIPLLVAENKDITCMDIDVAGAKSAFAEHADKVKVVRGDVTAFDDVIGAMIDSKAETVVNLSYFIGDLAPHVAFKLDVQGMDNCFEAARRTGVNHTLFASSLAVSGNQSKFGERMVDETDERHGSTQYAVNKIINEWQAHDYPRAYDMTITCIRPANVTGPDKVRGSTDHVQCVTLPAAGEPVSFPKAGLMRLPVHVDDIAEAFVRVTMVDKSHYPIYNSGGYPISLGDLAAIVKKFLPEAEINFASQDGKEESGNYLTDNNRLLGEFELEYPPIEQRILQIINDVRRDEGLPLVS